MDILYKQIWRKVAVNMTVTAAFVFLALIVLGVGSPPGL